MADLTITVAVTTGTQYQTGSSGNIYTFDGSQPASFTFPWVASGTVRLDQSASSNDNHPLIFSTSNSTTLGTMQAGIISSGVTYYLDGASNQSDYTNTTNFNAATTRYIEIAPASETDFYFACWVHGIGMGGIMDMTQDTWGALSWGTHSWGEQDTLNVFPTGLLTTAALGDVIAYNETGWGSDGWGIEDWGESGMTIPVTGYSITASLGDLAYAAAKDGWGRLEWGENDWGTDSLSVIPTGLSMTGSLGTMVAASEQGWGRATWGNEPWGDSNSPVVSLSGYSITATLGTLDYAQSEEGWGRDEWGYGNWGQNTTTVADITGFEMTGHMGPDGWGKIEWGESSWGGQPYVMNNLVPDVVGISGQSMTGSLGSPTINYDFIFALTNSFLGTVARGTLSINNGADHTQGLGGQAITGSLGSFPAGAPADVVQGLTALTGTMALGTAVTGELQKVAISGFGATASLGTLPALDYITVGLSGIAITGSNGTISPTSMSIGLTGYLITGSLGSSGVSPLGYKDIDITGNTSYTDVNVA